MTVNIQNDNHFLQSAAKCIRDHFICVTKILIATLLITLTVKTQTPEEVIKINTELVTFEITAFDTNGKQVSNLDQGDLQVLVNGSERQINFFQPLYDQNKKRPLIVVFALDVSGSMTENELDRLRSATSEFLKRLSADNAYFSLTTFSMDVKTVQKFTNRPSDIRRAFDKISKDNLGLSTHAYDAVDHAVRYINRNAPRSVRGTLPKKAVVVISDGFPVGDIVRPATVIERAQMADVSIYSVIMPSYSRLQGSRKPLMTPFEASGLIERTGGKSLYAGEQDLDPLFQALAEQIATSWIVAFYPEQHTENTGFNKVEIRSKKDLTIKQNRTGFTLTP